MRKDILSVLQKNHRMNLFSALNRERLADELLSVFRSSNNNNSSNDGIVVKNEAFSRNVQNNNLMVSESDRSRILSKTENQRRIQEEMAQVNVQKDSVEPARKSRRKPSKKTMVKKEVTKKVSPRPTKKSSEADLTKKIESGEIEVTHNRSRKQQRKPRPNNKNIVKNKKKLVEKPKKENTKKINKPKKPIPPRDNRPKQSRKLPGDPLKK